MLEITHLKCKPFSKPLSYIVLLQRNFVCQIVKKCQKAFPSLKTHLDKCTMPLGTSGLI